MSCGSYFPNLFDVQTLSRLSGSHGPAHAVAVAHSGCERVDAGFRDELLCLGGGGEKRVTGQVVDFRAAADVADFAFHKNVGPDRLQSLDGFLRLADVLFEWLARDIEDKPVVFGFCRFDRGSESVRVIGVQKDREFVLFAEALHNGRCLMQAHKFALAFGCSHDDGHIQLSSRIKCCLQSDQIGNVEMANRDCIVFGLLQRLPQCFHASLFDIESWWMTRCAPGSLLVAIQQVSRRSPVPYSIPDTWAGFSAAAPKFTLNRLHQMDTARY